MPLTSTVTPRRFPADAWEYSTENAGASISSRRKDGASPKPATGSPNAARPVPDPRTIVLPREDAVRREIRAKRIATFLASLDPTRAWELVVRPRILQRTANQNAYLW